MRYNTPVIHRTQFFAPTHTQTYATVKSGSLADMTQAIQHTKAKYLVEMQQVHSNSFVWVNSPTSDKVPNVDSVLTTNQMLTLAVRTADCLPILLYHSSGIVGALHAGRKSTQKGLLKKVLTHLKKEKQISSDLQLWFGPAICKTCYQIDQVTDTHFDLITENKAQAYAIYQPDHITIQIDAACTRCNSEKYHSYRVEGPGCLMNYAAISLTHP
jgi:polyphenol oxidase